MIRAGWTGGSSKPCFGSSGFALEKLVEGPLVGLRDAERVYKKSTARRPLNPRQELHHTGAGFQRLKDEHRFLLTRERPAVTEVVTWAASNGDRSENADYRYGKQRLRQIDGRIRFLTKRIEAAEVVDPREAPQIGAGGDEGRSSKRRRAMPMPRERSAS